MKDYAEKSVTLTTTGTTKDAGGNTIDNITTFTKKCVMYAIEDSIVALTLNNQDGSTVDLTNLSVSAGTPIYNASKITLTSGTVTCAE